MPLIFSAIAPHSPLLIPAIGKENLMLLRSTVAAYEKLEEDLYVKQADTIITISPHGPSQSESFTMNLNPHFNIDFEEFGDFSSKLQLAGDVGLAYRIREKMETKAPLQLVSQPRLDHGTAVPLYLLTKHLLKIKIIPLYYSGLDLNSHYNFGQLLKRELIIHKNRVAVIASGDLSHRLTKNSPGGYNAKGKKFDKKLTDCLNKRQIKDILALNHEFIADAGECGLKSIVILLGILADIKYTPLELSYEAPFGVGYLVMNFKL